MLSQDPDAAARAALRALMLGRLPQKLSELLNRKHLSSGRRSKTGGVTGASIRAEKAARRTATWESEYRKLKARNPRWTKGRIHKQIVADEAELRVRGEDPGKPVEPDSVGRALRKLRRASDSGT